MRKQRAARRICEALVLRRSAGFQTGLARVAGLVDTFPSEDTLSRFGNQRSAKDSRMRLEPPDSDVTHATPPTKENARQARQPFIRSR
jgi:hypothetical protein